MDPHLDRPVIGEWTLRAPNVNHPVRMRFIFIYLWQKSAPDGILLLPYSAEQSIYLFIPTKVIRFLS